ncbi:MAG: TerB family tellurite resistance protein [Nitrospirota bacterium]
MLNKIDSFFSKYLNKKGGKVQRAHNIEAATCAVLLEIAKIDEEFTNEEQKIINNILKKKFSLTDKEVDELVKLTSEELKQSSDLWHFTDTINKNFTKEQKVQLIEHIWQIIYSDKHLKGHEDYLVHKLQRLMWLDHKDLIDAKTKSKKGLHKT